MPKTTNNHGVTVWINVATASAPGCLYLIGDGGTGIAVVRFISIVDILVNLWLGLWLASD